MEKNKVYCDAKVGDSVRVVKTPSELNGMVGTVLDVNRYKDQADWYVVDMGPGVFVGPDTTMHFRASEVEKA